MISADPLALLTVEDLAQLWEIGTDWLKKGVAARRLPFTPVAGKIRFTREQAERILAMHAEEPATVPTADEVAGRRADALRT